MLPELFAGHYFCKIKDKEYFALAETAANSQLLHHFRELAARYQVVLPISFFERDGYDYYNSLAVIDADGVQLGLYRKNHIPTGAGYEEKFYFSNGNTGIQVWNTRFGTIGCGICWDQWFPELARAMVLAGADILLYPTAIGSEPQDPTLDSQQHWERVMQGHAAANMVPVVAANRVGVETAGGVSLTFYGSSFITDHTGGMRAHADRREQTIIHASLDLEAIRQARRSWGLFRDLRYDLYLHHIKAPSPIGSLS